MPGHRRTARGPAGARLTRRDAVRALGATATTAMVGSSYGTVTAQEATPATPAGAPAITVPDPVVTLPTEPVTFPWMDTGDSKAAFFRAFFPLYQEKHPNITIDYQPLPGPELGRIVPIGVQSGNAPDVFQTPPAISPAQMVTEGWIRPLDDVIPDFEAWKAHYPEGVLVEGVNVFNGQVYGFPYLSSRQYSTLCLYNVAYMQEAGYDPATKPLTWDEFRDAARKMTEAGGGQRYGLIIAGGLTERWISTVANLATMAGAKGGQLDWSTGQYNYTSEPFLAAIELLLAIRDDGSVFPGSLQFSPPEAESRLPEGVAGMCLQGPWNIPQWIRNNPDFAFGVASQPVPNDGEPIPLGIGPGSFIPMWLYAETEHPEIAADIFTYISSVEGQVAFANVTQGFPPPILPEAQATSGRNLDPRVVKAYDIFDQQLRVMPNPAVRNPAVAQVTLESRPLTPDAGETIQGLFTGQLTDAQAAMQDLQDRADAELERAIAAAREKGAEVTRDDWVFPNWDPTRDYTAEDYTAL